MTPSTKRVSHRGTLPKGVAVQGVLYQSTINEKHLPLTGRNRIGKCAQATGMTASLRILSSKADSNTWESFTRSELKMESVHQESPRSDIFRKRTTKPLLKQNHHQKHLTWAKEKKNWTVVLWRCWCSFPAGLGTCTHCQRYQKLVQWPWCYCAWLASKLAWPEPHREFMGYCQEEDERHQTQQCRWPEGRYQSNLGFHYTWAVPQADCLHATPHWGSNSCKMRPNQVHRNEHTFQKPDISVYIFFFYWSYVIFKFSETLNFGFSLSVSHNHQHFKK